MGSYSSAKKVMEWKELLIIACCVEVVLFIFGYCFGLIFGRQQIQANAFPCRTTGGPIFLSIAVTFLPVLHTQGS